MNISNTCLWVIIFIISVLFFLTMCRSRINGGVSWLDEESASSASSRLSSLAFPRSDAYISPLLTPEEEDKAKMDNFLLERRRLPDGHVMTLSEFILTFYNDEWQKKWHGEIHTVEEYAYWLDRSSGKINEEIWSAWMQLPVLPYDYANIPQRSPEFPRSSISSSSYIQ